MAQRGSGGRRSRIDHLLATYYHSMLVAAAALAPWLPVARPVRGASPDSSSDTEDPPLELPAVDPARGAPHPPPPLPVAGGAALRLDFSGARPLRSRRAPRLIEGEGSSWREANGGERERGARAGARNGHGISKGGASAASPEEIYKALIPDLARADLLRAYSKLIRDDRRFRSLMALPKHMRRREWLLMEIGEPAVN